MVYRIALQGKFCAVLWFALFFFAWALTAGNSEEAIQTTPCELKADPPAFDRKLVTVRSGVTIGFENSSFDVTCQNDVGTSVWVTLGGDVEMPIVFCCGDHSRKPGTALNVNGFKLSLNKDAEYKKFVHYLMAERKKAPSGVPCFWDCFQYRVTATLTGHFFAGHEWKRPDDGEIIYEGYGHFGFYSLFVIEKVSEVEFQPAGIPIGDNFECDHQKWQLPVDRSIIIGQQKTVQSGMRSEPDIDDVGEQLVKERMKTIGDDFDAGDARSDYEGKFQKERKATYIWLSNDKLKSYRVSFQRFDWLSKIAKKIDDRVWTPVVVERGECKAKP